MFEQPKQVTIDDTMVAEFAAWKKAIFTRLAASNPTYQGQIAALTKLRQTALDVKQKKDALEQKRKALPPQQVAKRNQLTAQIHQLSGQVQTLLTQYVSSKESFLYQTDIMFGYFLEEKKNIKGPIQISYSSDTAKSRLFALNHAVMLDEVETATLKETHTTVTEKFFSSALDKKLVKGSSPPRAEPRGFVVAPSGLSSLAKEAAAQRRRASGERTSSHTSQTPARDQAQRSREERRARAQQEREERTRAREQAKQARMVFQRRKQAERTEAIAAAVETYCGQNPSASSLQIETYEQGLGAYIAQKLLTMIDFDIQEAIQEYNETISPMSTEPTGSPAHYMSMFSPDIPGDERSPASTVAEALRGLGGAPQSSRDSLSSFDSAEIHAGARKLFEPGEALPQHDIPDGELEPLKAFLAEHQSPRSPSTASPRLSTEQIDTPSAIAPMQASSPKLETTRFNGVGLSGDGTSVNVLMGSLEQFFYTPGNDTSRAALKQYLNDALLKDQYKGKPIFFNMHGARAFFCNAVRDITRELATEGKIGLPKFEHDHLQIKKPFWFNRKARALWEADERRLAPSAPSPSLSSSSFDSDALSDVASRSTGATSRSGDFHAGEQAFQFSNPFYTGTQRPPSFIETKPPENGLARQWSDTSAAMGDFVQSVPGSASRVRMMTPGFQQQRVTTLFAGQQTQPRAFDVNVLVSGNPIKYPLFVRGKTVPAMQDVTGTVIPRHVERTSNGHWIPNPQLGRDLYENVIKPAQEEYKSTGNKVIIDLSRCPTEARVALYFYTQHNGGTPPGVILKGPEIRANHQNAVFGTLNFLANRLNEQVAGSSKIKEALETIGQRGHELTFAKMVAKEVKKPKEIDLKKLAKIIQKVAKRVPAMQIRQMPPKQRF